MTITCRNPRAEDGLATVEWLLLLGGIVLPAVFMTFEIMRALAAFYAVTSWLVALPFP